MEQTETNKGELFTKIKQLPKIELHAHLNGSIRKSTLMEALSEEDKERIHTLYSVMDFNSAMEFFKITSKVASTIELVKRITREMIEDWNKNNTIYLEIRTSLKDTKNYNKKEYLNAILEEIDICNHNINMVTRLIISLDRTKSIKEYEEVLSIYRTIKNQTLKNLIVGIDYSGNEVKEKHKYEDIIPIFKKFKEEGLKITIHMGECTNYQQFPFDIFLPDRTSHAHFFSDDDYISFMKRKIPIEICPTSSFKCTHSNNYKEIPFSKIYNKKIIMSNGSEYTYDLVSINTDDTMLLLTDISQEYFEISSNFTLDIKKLKELIIKGIDSIFEKDESVKKRLREIVNEFKIN